MTSPADLIASVVEALKDPSVRAGLLEAVVKPAVEAAVKEAVAANNEEVARLIQVQDEQRARIDELETQVRKLSTDRHHRAGPEPQRAGPVRP